MDVDFWVRLSIYGWNRLIITVGLRNDFQKKEEGFLDEYWVELCSEKLNPRDLTFFLG